MINSIFINDIKKTLKKNSESCIQAIFSCRNPLPHYYNYKNFFLSILTIINFVQWMLKYIIILLINWLFNNVVFKRTNDSTVQSRIDFA